MGGEWASVKGQRLVHRENLTRSCETKLLGVNSLQSYQWIKGDYREAEDAETPKRLGIL
jgi:hypothetical protein